MIAKSVPTDDASAGRYSPFGGFGMGSHVFSTTIVCKRNSLENKITIKMKMTLWRETK